MSMLLVPTRPMELVDGEELGMEEVLSVQVDLDPGLEKLLVIRPLGPRHEDLIPYFGKDEVDIHAAKHGGLQGLEHRFVGYEIRRGIVICLRAPWIDAIGASWRWRGNATVVPVPVLPPKRAHSRASASRRRWRGRRY